MCWPFVNSGKRVSTHWKRKHQKDGKIYTLEIGKLHIEYAANKPFIVKLLGVKPIS